MSIFDAPFSNSGAIDCDCSCHREEGTKHVVACCEPCPVCRFNLRGLDREAHKAECGELE